MKRKLIKGSLLSLALSLSMVVNMSVPAFAESIPEEVFADEKAPEAAPVSVTEEADAQESTLAEGLSEPEYITEEADATSGKTIRIGTDGLKKGQSVYFGTLDTSRFSMNAPFVWRILDPSKDVSGDAGMFLLSENLIGNPDGSGIVFFNSANDIYPDSIEPEAVNPEHSYAWTNSNAQQFCRNFSMYAFSYKELSVIKEVSKTVVRTEDAASVEASPSANDNLDNEKVFFLSADEIKNYISATTGAALIANYRAGTPAAWWSRSGNFIDQRIRDAYIVNDEGGFGTSNHDYDNNSQCYARPAININTSKVILSSPATGGKSAGSNGTFSAVTSGNTSEWKLTIRDESGHPAVFSASIGEGKTSEVTVKAGDKINVNYAGAVVEDNEVVSGLFCDSTGKDALYFGHLATIGANGNTSGTASVTVPADLPSGEYTLKVFNERVNGDKKTDYASNVVDLKVIVKIGSNENKNKNNDIIAPFELLPVNEAAAKELITSLYSKLLGRDMTEEELKVWLERIVSRKVCLADVVKSFIESDEFKARRLDNEGFVSAIYEGVFGRKRDYGEGQQWVDKLNMGISKSEVLASILNSEEFANVCEKMNAARGLVSKYCEITYNEGVYRFVSRYYQCMLGRKGEINGIEYWCEKIHSKKETPLQIAFDFFNSNEFKAINYSDEEFVDIMYYTFLGRYPDAGGKQYWLERLSNEGREVLLNGFANSVEFRIIMDSYNFSFITYSPAP